MILVELRSVCNVDNDQFNFTLEIGPGAGQNIDMKQGNCPDRRS